jgi:D-lyxose ketol-isomerase
MITRNEQLEARKAAAELFEKAGVLITREEADRIDVVDFGLSNLKSEGAQILTMVQTDRISVKLLALMPNQTEPEHWHPPVGDDPGKEETVRHVWGDLYFYVRPDSPAAPMAGDRVVEGFIPEGKDDYYTCRKEIVMEPGQQLTAPPGDMHWFQAGPRGCVLFSFSTVARDVLDGFTDPNVDRVTRVAEDE